MEKKVEFSAAEIDEVCKALGELELKAKEAHKVLAVIQFFQKKFSQKPELAPEPPKES